MGSNSSTWYIAIQNCTNQLHLVVLPLSNLKIWSGKDLIGRDETPQFYDRKNECLQAKYPHEINDYLVGSIEWNGLTIIGKKFDIRA